MKQQVDITLKLCLWLDATMDEDAIVTHVRAALPDAFGEALTDMENPVDILAINQEAEIYDESDVNQKRLEALRFLTAQADEDCPAEYRSEHFKEALNNAKDAIAEANGEGASQPNATLPTQPLSRERKRL